MKARLAPKYHGLADALAVVALASIAMAAAAWVPRWLPIAFPVRPPVAETRDAETIRIERAVESLRQAALVERAQRADRDPGSDTILPLHSPSAIAAATALESQSFDASALNVVIVETDRGRMAVIEGLPVRVGERMAGGGIVRAIEKTGVVIEDAAGTRRSVDLRDRFVRQDGTSVPTPHRATNPGTEK